MLQTQNTFIDPRIQAMSNILAGTSLGAIKSTARSSLTKDHKVDCNYTSHLVIKYKKTRVNQALQPK